MKPNNYEAEQIWLQAYFEYCEQIELSIEAQLSMQENAVTLPEVLHVLRTGIIVWAERNHDGCIYAVKGRNCDEEEITVLGGFNSEMQLVSAFLVEKN